MVEINNLVRSNVLTLQPYSSARSKFTGKDGTFLDANENPFGTLNRYPDPQQSELKKKLAQLKGVNTQNIFVGNGSDEVIDLAFRIFCNPGKDKALTFSPTYGMYNVSAAINNIELIEQPLNSAFQIDLPTLRPYFNDPSIKLMFICSPNNPTGNLIDRAAIDYILTNFKGIVIVDEAYIDFATDESLISMIDQYNNLIVSQTFSKAWGLAAARLGTAYADKEIINLYNKVKPPYNVSELNQKAANEALDKIKKYEENLAVILSERKRVEKALSNIKEVQKVYPSDANYILIEVQNADQLYTDLVNQNIITRNRNNQVKNCIRISIGTPEENNILINAIKNIK
ncbi:histidinol-phosphate transaminase [Brumimicrobium salinarum]|uniref:Histidinol-phosphate aminotransferase n=1 Tax=Brumimicrobium salinarum TaxID=2058658 RepID=A0A2I0R195_9FLAO|nr:histidinol-phosphate transaminase [Brumimicrobium salinarum]PKR80170.1 histidinol-phosphate transaminase [Brumimicrobium salinarum]